MSPPYVTAPVKVLPYSRENLLAILPEPSMASEACAICSKIPGLGVGRFVKGGEVERDTLVPEVEQLEFFLRLGDHVNTDWIEICPICSRLFHIEHSYEFLMGGSEDTDSYQAISPEKIAKMPEIGWSAKRGPVELHQGAGGEWAVTNAKAK